MIFNSYILQNDLFSFMIEQNYELPAYFLF